MAYGRRNYTANQLEGEWFYCLWFGGKCNITVQQPGGTCRFSEEMGQLCRRQTEESISYTPNMNNQWWEIAPDGPRLRMTETWYGDLLLVQHRRKNGKWRPPFFASRDRFFALFVWGASSLEDIFLLETQASEVELPTHANNVQAPQVVGKGSESQRKGSGGQVAPAPEEEPSRTPQGFSQFAIDVAANRGLRSAGRGDDAAQIHYGDQSRDSNGNATRVSVKSSLVCETVGCSRPALGGYKTCCRTCASSQGASHGPKCEQMVRTINGAVQQQQQEEAPMCKIGCGRRAAEGFKTCCRACAITDGNSHDSNCPGGEQRSRSPAYSDQTIS